MNAPTIIEPAPPELEDLHLFSQAEKLTHGKVRQATLNWDLRHRSENGLAPAFIKLGKRFHVWLPKYLALKAAHATGTLPRSTTKPTLRRR